MGRKRAMEVRKYFEKDDNKQKCIIANCNQVLTGDNVTNMIRHIEKKHSELFLKIQMIHEEVPQKKNTGTNISINTSEKILWEGCMELATTGGLPLSFINNNGFKKIVGPIKEKLIFKRELNVPNLKLKINETAAEIKNLIKEQVKNCLISLKIDSVTRHCRSLLGVNIQYECDNKIQVKTLAIKELSEKHTAFYIKTRIQEVIKEYGISLKQIYTITSDNGKNMIKSKSLLREDLESELNEYFELENRTNVQQNEIIEENIEQAENLLTAESNNLINCIRCAAHTLQLVMYDAIKDENLAIKIAACHKLVICLRKPSNYAIIKSKNLKKPKLNIATRWNSTFDMIERLLELKQFCMESRDKDLFVDEDLWDFMKEFLKVFGPIKKTTLCLQDTQMTLGEFYKNWLCLKLELQKLDSPMISPILNIIRNREKLIMENHVVLSAIYLDPRFSFILSEEEKITAQNHLKNLYNIQQSLRNRTIQLEPIPSTSINESQIENVDDDLSTYLNSIEASRKNSTIENLKEKAHLELIITFSPERIQDHTINVLTYWKSKCCIYPTLSSLAKIIHAVPATQVTVERSFSGLKLILADERNRLSDNSLENILMVKLNHNFT